MKKQKLGLGSFVKDNSQFKTEGVGNFAAAGAGLGAGMIDAIEGDNKTGVGQGLSGAMKGAAAGAAGGPIGMAAGAVIGAATSIIKLKAEQKKQEEIKKQAEKDLLDSNSRDTAATQTADNFEEEQKMFSGGVVKGKGGIDKVAANLPTDAFVVPVKNAKHPVVKDAAALLGLGTADKTKGSNKVMLTKGEVVIAPKDVPVVDKLARIKGMVDGIHGLAPDADTDADGKKCGGKVKKKHMVDGGTVSVKKLKAKYKFVAPGDATAVDVNGDPANVPSDAFPNPEQALTDKLSYRKMLKPGADVLDTPVDGTVGAGVVTPVNGDATLKDGLTWQNPDVFKAKYGEPAVKKEKPNVGTALGIAQGGIGFAGLMATGSSPIEDGLPEYKISPVIQNDVALLAARRDKGLDDAVKNSMERSIENERQTNVGLAKEYSGGSGTTAFNRAILANSNATEKRSSIAIEDQAQRNKNLEASMTGDKMLSDLERTVYEDKMKKKLLHQGQWEQKQEAWGKLLSSGIENVIGSKQLAEAKASNEKLNKIITGGK